MYAYRDQKIHKMNLLLPIKEVENRGGYDPLTHGLKAHCRPRLTLRSRSIEYYLVSRSLLHHFKIVLLNRFVRIAEIMKIVIMQA